MISCRADLFKHMPPQPVEGTLSISSWDNGKWWQVNPVDCSRDTLNLLLDALHMSGFLTENQDSSVNIAQYGTPSSTRRIDPSEFVSALVSHMEALGFTITASPADVYSVKIFYERMEE
jgi:hypothetical protein